MERHRDAILVGEGSVRRARELASSWKWRFPSEGGGLGLDLRNRDEGLADADLEDRERKPDKHGGRTSTGADIRRERRRRHERQGGEHGTTIRAGDGPVQGGGGGAG